MALTAREAGERVGKTRQAIIKAIRKGTLSAEKDAAGEWRIEPAELFWVYQAVPAVDVTSPQPGCLAIRLGYVVNLRSAMKGSLHLSRGSLPWRPTKPIYEKTATAGGRKPSRRPAADRSAASRKATEVVAVGKVTARVAALQGPPIADD